MACLFSGRGENAGILAHSRHQTHFVSLLLLDGNVKRGVWGTQFPDGGPASIGRDFIFREKDFLPAQFEEFLREEFVVA